MLNNVCKGSILKTILTETHLKLLMETKNANWAGHVMVQQSSVLISVVM